MRDSVFYLQHDDDFDVWRKTLRDSILASSDSVRNDFWAHEMLLLLDTFSNNLTTVDRNKYFNELDKSLDTSAYNQLFYFFQWLEFLEKEDYKKKYYIMLLDAAKSRHEKTGNLSFTYEYATLVAMEDKKAAFEIIDSCYQLHGDTLYLKYMRENLKNALDEP